MSGIADRGHEVFEAIDEALEEIVERQATFDERLRGVDAGTRMELFTLSNEIRTERRITADLVAAVDKRMDRFERVLTDSLARLERVLTTNGSGGSHV